jgi:hypothetical protein
VFHLRFETNYGPIVFNVWDTAGMFSGSSLYLFQYSFSVCQLVARRRSIFMFAHCLPGQPQFMGLAQAY